MLVCRKCSRRLDGGFGADGDEPLAKVLRRALGAAKKGKKARKARAGVIEVGCLDVCPKGAVVVIGGAEPGRWRVVPRKTPVQDVLAELGLAGD